MALEILMASKNWATYLVPSPISDSSVWTSSTFIFQGEVVYESLPEQVFLAIVKLLSESVYRLPKSPNATHFQMGHLQRVPLAEAGAKIQLKIFKYMLFR